MTFKNSPIIVCFLEEKKIKKNNATQKERKEEARQECEES